MTDPATSKRTRLWAACIVLGLLAWVVFSLLAGLVDDSDVAAGVLTALSLLGVAVAAVGVVWGVARLVRRSLARS